MATEPITIKLPGSSLHMADMTDRGVGSTKAIDCVRVEIVDNKPVMVATDAIRLIRLEWDEPAPPPARPNCDANIPAEAFAGLLRAGVGRSGVRWRGGHWMPDWLRLTISDEGYYLAATINGREMGVVGPLDSRPYVPWRMVVPDLTALEPSATQRVDAGAMAKALATLAKIIDCNADVDSPDGIIDMQTAEKPLIVRMESGRLRGLLLVQPRRLKSEAE